MTNNLADGVWLTRGAIIAALVIIMALLGLGYGGLNSTLQRIENNQLSMKAEFLEKIKDSNIKIDSLCKKLDQHDSWLRVPFETRQKYFLQDSKKEMNP